MKKPAPIFRPSIPLGSAAAIAAIGFSSLSLFGDEEKKNPHPERDNRDRPPAAHREAEERGRQPEHHDRPQGRPHSDQARHFEAQVNELRKQLEKLNREGRDEDADAVERRLREMMAHREQAQNRGREREDHDRNPKEHFEAMEHRIHHLHAAAENLEQVGMHREAGELHEQAERIEQELHAEHQRHEEPRHEVEALHRKVAELNEVVHDLRRHVEKLEEAIHDLREELTDDD